MNLWARDLPALEKLPRLVPPTDGTGLAALPFLLLATDTESLIVPLLMLEMLPKSDSIDFF